MELKKYYRYSLALVAALSAYPLYMGISVLVKMVQEGAVPIAEYPKYVIPYAPIALALIAGVLLMPLLQRLPGKLGLFVGPAAAVAVFFPVERFMETKVLVQAPELAAQEAVVLESWQMSLCYAPPEMYETRTWEAVDVLLGGYSPAFKFHFYLISIVIIVSLLNCFYGFARMLLTGDTGRKKALTIQAITSVAFLGMCIWACFTAFYRSGELTVSALSAVLMALFFALLGVTMGVFAASFALGKRRALSEFVPAMIAASVTFLMYIGEMVLLNGNLYRFGQGIFFDGLGKLVLAPVDILVIIVSGLTTCLICKALNSAGHVQTDGRAG